MECMFHLALVENEYYQNEIARFHWSVKKINISNES